MLSRIYSIFKDEDETRDQQQWLKCQSWKKWACQNSWKMLQPFCPELIQYGSLSLICLFLRQITHRHCALTELIERWDGQSVLRNKWSQCEGAERLVEDKNLINTLRESCKTRMINWYSWPEVSLYESVGGSMCADISVHAYWLYLGESSNKKGH